MSAEFTLTSFSVLAQGKRNSWTLHRAKTQLLQKDNAALLSSFQTNPSPLPEAPEPLLETM